MIRAFMLRCVAISLLLFTVSGCSPKAYEVALNTVETPPEVLLRLVDSRGQGIRSMVGRGSVTFESPEVAGTASFQSSMKKPDTLLVTLEGPFGIDVGMFFLTREKYSLYNSLENSVITGIPNATAMRSVIPFDLTYEEILNAFSGVFAVPHDLAGLTSYRIDEDLFFLSFRCGENICNYWVDARYLLVARYEVVNPQNKILLEAVSSWFTQQGDLSVAKRIVLKFPQEKRRLSISYSSLTLNVSNPRFDFNVPANARTIVQ